MNLFLQSKVEGDFKVDERYEQSILEELVDTYVVEGDAYLQRHPNIELLEETLEGTDIEAEVLSPSIYDIDNISITQQFYLW